MQQTGSSNRWGTGGSLLAGTAAAIGASACCAGPLILVLLGVSGAWGSRLLALQPFQPFFAVGAVVAFGLAFQRLYLKREACAPGKVCAMPPVRRRQRVVFWTLAVIATALMTFPLYAPLFY